MRIRILGSSAGGGFPQWNCNCNNCNGLRQGSIKATPRMQSSIAVSHDGKEWILINASPDIHRQLNLFSDFQPATQLRDTAIKGVILVDSQLDHTGGLLLLREGSPLEVYCTETVSEDLKTGYPVFKLLEHYCGMNHHLIDNTKPFIVSGIESLEFRPIILTGKAPPYSTHRYDPHPGDNIGLLITDKNTQKSIFYAPGLGEMSDELITLMKSVDCLLVDGTFWREDEMQWAGINHKTAQEMGHLPQSGEHGMINVLQQIKRPRKVLIHINNTNPILNEESEERALLKEHHIEVAFDGMELIV